jgi:acylphosphatase
MRHLDILIEGDVQGVGFRWAARREAASLGVNGYVRNEDDGSVRIEAEADDATLDLFTAWCRRGPGSARVEHVAVKQGVVRRYSGFEIRF